MRGRNPNDAHAIQFAVLALGVGRVILDRPCQLRCARLRQLSPCGHLRQRVGLKCAASSRRLHQHRDAQIEQLPRGAPAMKTLAAYQPSWQLRIRASGRGVNGGITCETASSRWLSILPRRSRAIDRAEKFPLSLAACVSKVRTSWPTLLSWRRLSWHRLVELSVQTA